MGGRRISGRRLSMSRAAKQYLKDKKRKEKLGISAKTPEVSRKDLWILVLAALVLFGLVVAWSAAKGGFGW